MKKFLIFLLVPTVFMALFVACQAAPAEKGSGNDNGEPKEIRVFLPEHPYADLLIPLLPEFEEKTGITVIMEQMNENELTEKQLEGIATGTQVADVFMTRPATETLRFLENNWMMPLNGFDFSDFPANTAEIGLKDGIPHYIPLVIEWHTLFYRKDLLENAGLSVPTTIEELEEAAKILNRGGVAGFASRGAGFPAVSQISSFIYNYGGRYIEDGRAVFDSPEAVDAIRTYGRILGVSGPNGINEMSWSEIMSIFQAGNLAMWTDASVFYSQLIDPEHSQIPPEHVGVASFPRGPAADEAYIITGWGMSISSMTEDVDSAVAFLTWATSREIAEKAMLVNIPMARLSVWNDPAITTHLSPEMVATMLHASEFGFPYVMPLMTSIFQARELIGEVISESINTRGTSPRLQELATQKTEEVNDLLKADGEYGTAR